MELVVRYRITLAIVAVALATTGCFLAFGLPRVPNPSEDQRQVDFARVHHYSMALVRRTFAAHGIELRYSIKDLFVVWLTDVRPPVPDSGLYILVATKRSKGASWGPKPAGEYDQPVGNLLVHYGGHDPAILARVKAAVAALPR